MSTGLQLRQADTMNLTELQTLGQVFTKSGFFADTKDAAQAVVKVMAGMELGFPAIASMTGVYIVKGKVSLSANLMGAAIKKSRKYNYRVRQLDDKGCKIEFFEDNESVGFSEFTRADAQNAGLAGSDTYKKFFRNMVFARALSNGAKWYCPDIFGGPIYTPEELGAEVDGEGEVITLPPEDAEPIRAIPAELHERLDREAQAGENYIRRAAEPITSVGFQEAHPPEPEPVKTVKLEGAQPTREPSGKLPSLKGYAGQITALANTLGWTEAYLREEVISACKVELMDDLAVALPELSQADAKKMIQILRSELEARNK